MAPSREPAIAVPVPAAPVALYVHVPFCVSLCPYCDFVVYAGTAARGPAARVEAYLGALRAEIGLRADAVEATFGAPGSEGRAPLETVYVGGGTPTLLSSEALASLLDLVRARFGIAEGAEVTIESNPGPDERGNAGALVAAGFNRLSLGAQAMDAASLRRLGRRHRPGDVAAAVGEARAAGFRSVSLDLLYDVPGQSTEAWGATLDAALALAPDHVSAYALTLDDPDEEGLTGPLGDHLPTRPGARRWREAAAPEQSEDRAAEQYALAVDRLGSGRISRLRDLQLGPARAREPAQPRLLAAAPVRGGRSGSARLRRDHAPVERSVAGRVPRARWRRRVAGRRPRRRVAPNRSRPTMPPSKR